MPNIKIRIKVAGAEIEAEGPKTDIEGLIESWWLKIGAEREVDDPYDEEVKLQEGTPAPKRAKRKAAKVKDGAKSQSDNKMDANEFANKIKQNPKFPIFQKTVLHATDRYNKVALVCYLSSVPLTSGDIQRTLFALGVKIGGPDVSKMIALKSGNFMNSIPRKAGGSIAKYELTSHAKQEFEKALNELSKGK